MSKVAEKIEMMQISALIPYARNSRIHSKEQIDQIAASIHEFGFTNPILIDRDGGIIAGHGRVLGAQQLDLKYVPCIRLMHLTENQKRAYVIADNQIAMNGKWDDELLASELSSLISQRYDTSLLGFNIDTEALIADLLAPTPFEKQNPNNFREENEQQVEYKNLEKFPVTVILDEKEFAIWNELKEKKGYSDKRLLIELLEKNK